MFDKMRRWIYKMNNLTKSKLSYHKNNIKNQTNIKNQNSL